MSGHDPLPLHVPVSAQRCGQYWILVPGDAAGNVAVVNDMGYRIFAQCDGSRSHATIARAVAERDDAALELVHRDVDAFLAHLSSIGLLRPNP